MTRHDIDGVVFSDDDVVNIEDFIPEGDYNPQNVRPFILHDHGFTLAVVFASSYEEAIDIAIEEEKLEKFKILPSIYNKDDDCESYYVGSDGEFYDLECVSYIELKNPKLSFCKLLME